MFITSDGPLSNGRCGCAGAGGRAGGAAGGAGRAPRLRPRWARSAELAALPGWWGLPAVKAGRVYVADACALPAPGAAPGAAVNAHHQYDVFPVKMCNTLGPDISQCQCPSCIALSAAACGPYACMSTGAAQLRACLALHAMASVPLAGMKLLFAAHIAAAVCHTPAIVIGVAAERGVWGGCLIRWRAWRCWRGCCTRTPSCGAARRMRCSSWRCRAGSAAGSASCPITSCPSSDRALGAARMHACARACACACAPRCNALSTLAWGVALLQIRLAGNDWSQHAWKVPHTRASDCMLWDSLTALVLSGGVEASGKFLGREGRGRCRCACRNTLSAAALS